MAGNAIIWISIGVAVLSFFLPFILIWVEAKKGKKNSLPQEVTEDKEKEERRRKAHRDYFMFNFLHLRSGPVRGSKAITIRPEYHERIKLITQVIGRRRIPMTSYLDSILMDHFDRHAEAINDLYRIKSDSLIKPDKPCRR